MSEQSEKKQTSKPFHIYGKLVINGNIRAVTGLHIGKGKESISIGGLENAVMRDPLTNAPFIPGSSLKGKLRSLAEKRDPKCQFNSGKDIKIHVCENRKDYEECPICRLFGVPGDKEASAPTRLVVRDVQLEAKSEEDLSSRDLDQPYTEIKSETTIDRVTSKANPRSLERAPANTVFGPFEIIFSIYKENDTVLLKTLIETMGLLEDDYLGGSGSRGSGKILFEGMQFLFKSVESYGDPSISAKKEEAKDLAEALNKLPKMVQMMKTEFKLEKAHV
jgi:CRISPR-associated protein Csm3